MFTSDLTPTGTADVERVQRPDTECRALASQFLAGLIGTAPGELAWDNTHRLQGHASIGGRELVVIAPRDDDHHTVVLTAHDWAQVRLAGADRRGSLLSAYAIADRVRMAALLGADAVLAAA
jgi:hypothetical protein